MTVLTWDKTGSRIYQTAVDHGVLFLQDGTYAVWNGLTSVEEDSATTLTSYYLDGVKFLDNMPPGDFTGTLKAFTYPDEFDQVIGIVTVAPGLFYHDQPLQTFNLTYQTKIGNDLDGLDHGYKIHLLYNLLANPAAISFDTIKDSGNAPIEFQWSLTGVPPKIQGNRPTVHISIDSRSTDPNILELLENIIYGTVDSNPRFPTITEIAGLFGYYGALIIQDNGDGTWTAIDESNSYITMTDPTTFEIDNADATFLDDSTYTISSTNTT